MLRRHNGAALPPSLVLQSRTRSSAGLLDLKRYFLEKIFNSHLSPSKSRAHSNILDHEASPREELMRAPQWLSHCALWLTQCARI
jgi:hypothetical protein